MSERIIYTTVQVRVPEKAHKVMKKAAKKGKTSINQKYVEAAELLANRDLNIRG